MTCMLENHKARWLNVLKLDADRGWECASMVRDVTRTHTVAVVVGRRHFDRNNLPQTWQNNSPILEVASNVP